MPPCQNRCRPWQPWVSALPAAVSPNLHWPGGICRADHSPGVDSLVTIWYSPSWWWESESFAWSECDSWNLGSLVAVTDQTRSKSTWLTSFHAAILAQLYEASFNRMYRSILVFLKWTRGFSPAAPAPGHSWANIRWKWNQGFVLDCLQIGLV